MSECQIRGLANNEEIKDVYNLIKEIKHIELPPYKKWKNKVLHFVYPTIRLAVEKSVIIGIAIYDIIPSYTGDMFTWLYCLAVKPEYRKRGIGTELMKVVRKESKYLGSKSISFICNKKNKAAIRFYEQLGVTADPSWLEMEWDV